MNNKTTLPNKLASANPELPSTPAPNPTQNKLIFKIKSLSLLHLALAILLLVILVISIYLINQKTKENVSYDVPPLNQPSPSPQKTSPYAPQLQETEASLDTLEQKTTAIEISNHSLLPPSLDLQVTLVK